MRHFGRLVGAGRGIMPIGLEATLQRVSRDGRSNRKSIVNQYLETN